MTVKAKFKVHSVMPGYGEGDKVIRANAVYSQDGENADFSSATPSGNFDLYINGGRPAAEFFKQGQTIYLTIEDAPAK
jgi:hypothetical protein